LAPAEEKALIERRAKRPFIEIERKGNGHD
jgi:hypothetical protein